MQSFTKSMRLLTDPARLRIILLIEQEELNVNEIQEILAMGQSRISTHLSQLKGAGLLEDRRSGKNVLYRLHNAGQWQDLLGLLRRAAAEIPETVSDQRALELILRKRQDKTRAYFDSLAGKFGKQYVPGRSWKGLAETLLLLLPPMDIADLGCGEGTFTQLLARRARHVVAIDNSEKMVAYAAEIAQRNGLENVEFRLGDLENPPIADASVDLAFFSQSLHHAQHPARAVASAARILRPGGRIVILDLKTHAFAEARDLYADLWLGFAEVELDQFLKAAGFREISIATVHREEETPQLETLLAIAQKN